MTIEIVATIIAILATVPVLTFLILFFIFKAQTKNTTRSIQLAADFSAIFFIIAVSALFYILFENHYIPWIVIGYLIVLLIVLVYQFTNQEELLIKKSFRIVWRIGFMIMFVLYILLFFVTVILFI